MNEQTAETSHNMLSHNGLSELGRTDTNLHRQVLEAVENVAVFDLHTHLFAPQFGKLNLWGIDELLNYHYLIAEMFRFSSISYQDFWQLEKSKQVDLIWQTLFVENTPISEAARGVVNVLKAFGLNPKANNLNEFRGFFTNQTAEDFINQTLKIANVSDIVMTNNPLDEDEIEIWESGQMIDQRFHAALRLDSFLNDWKTAVPLMQKQGYDVHETVDNETVKQTVRFLNDWIQRMKPLYLAASLPDDFRYPEDSIRGELLKKVVLPICRANKIPLALMIGVRRQINPQLRLAGDGLGRADVTVLSNICEENHDIRFLATFLSRENQHELCVVARKFNNLMPFGCWWFVNNTSMIEEITRERIELLGTSFIPQHSDARILDQLIYKWSFSRRIIGEVLADYYVKLAGEGFEITKAEIERDVQKMFAGNFKKWVGFND